MKILCLHGMGTNADILKAQTASFRTLLPSHFDFDFLEGEHDCSAAEGISEIYPEPYMCWYSFPPSLDRVADAQEMIWEIINQDGPFDGVLGFSQGAALAASVLLHHEMESPLTTSPFRFAIFICGSLPFSSDEKCGFDLADVMTKHSDPMSGDIAEWRRLIQRRTSPEVSYFDRVDRADELKSLVTITVDSPDGVCTPCSEDGLTEIASTQLSPQTPATPFYPEGVATDENNIMATSLAEKIEGLAVSRTPMTSIRRFHPTIDKVRISIPTTHIYGKNDPYLQQSLQLVNMCQTNLTHVLDHGGAHDIPRSESVSRAIADVIEKTITKSEFMF